jgi:hypothetical protein
MSTYTEEEVITLKKCGVKYFDEAVNNVGRKELLNRAVKICQEFPDTWGAGWRNFDWALGNAVRDCVKSQGEFQMSWNVDEVLTGEEIAEVAVRLGFIDAYNKCWPRRTKAIVHRQKVTGKLSTDVIRVCLDRVFIRDLSNASSELATWWERVINVPHRNDNEVTSNPDFFAAKTYAARLAHKDSKKNWHRNSKKRSSDGGWVREFWALWGHIYGVYVYTDVNDTTIIRINALRRDIFASNETTPNIICEVEP